MDREAKAALVEREASDLGRDGWKVEQLEECSREQTSGGSMRRM